MLQIVDAQWKDHLYSLDHLKEGIGLRGYGQRDPLVEYKKESFALFPAMKDRIEEEIVRYLWRLTPVVGEDAARAPVRQPPARRPPQITTSAHEPAPSPFGAIASGDRRTPATRTAAPGAHRRRRRDQAGEARRAEGRTQRPVPVRQRQEVQEVPWGLIKCASAPVRQCTDEAGSRASLPFCFAPVGRERVGVRPMRTKKRACEWKPERTS